MREPDDRDLSSAFDELTAPPSTANYATRTPALPVRTSSTRWPQVLAGAVAVAVAVAGAGTFLALRSARQGGAPAASAGTPPARSGAAIAYDSTTGRTVMFGGIGRSGQGLSDTWTWDGSAWSSGAVGPGALDGARMVDDPADGGVLLIGTPALPVNGGVVGSGCSGGASAVPGTSTGSSPLPAIAPGSSATASAGPTATCPAPAPPPSVQTWLFTSSGWHRAAAGSASPTPPAGAELAFDPTSREVVAVSPFGITCGPPLAGAVRNSAAIACPLVGATGSSAATTTMPCAEAQPQLCFGASSVSTWTWSSGTWRTAATDPSLQPPGPTILFTDPAAQRAVLMSQAGIGSGSLCCLAYPQIKCTATQPCPPTVPSPEITTWTWSGNGWVRISQVHAPPQGPELSGATVTATAGHLLVLTAAGDTWTFAAGQWSLDAPTQHPGARTGAAMAEAPGGGVVLFGGTVSPGFFASAGGVAVGSDTWLWNGRTWQLRGGTPPSTPPSPSFSCGPLGQTAVPPCVQPAQTPAVSPVTVPPSTPAAHGTPIAQATP